MTNAKENLNLRKKYTNFRLQIKRKILASIIQTCQNLEFSIKDKNRKKTSNHFFWMVNNLWNLKFQKRKKRMVLLNLWLQVACRSQFRWGKNLCHRSKSNNPILFQKRPARMMTMRNVLILCTKGLKKNSSISLNAKSCRRQNLWNGKKSQV